MDCLVINGYGVDKVGVGFPGSRSAKMDDNAAREDACREYQSSLEDLTFNSKPHINMLTILAEENINFAKDIVAIIEAQISKAPATEKLPVLYLVDSIVKNVGGEYLAVFAKNLIPSFICVFEKVDENTRKSLFKLRSTWDDVFPPKKLYALDVRVNSQDPAWPIKPLPPTVNASIHVNPKFLKQSDEASSPRPVPVPVPVPPQPAPVAPQPTPTAPQSSLTQEQLIRQQLLAKQKQLLELQQKKIELELEQTKAQLAGGFVLPPQTTSTATTALKASSQTAPVVRPWKPPSQTQPEPKQLTRDPRLNRVGPPAPPQAKERPTGKKDSPPAIGNTVVTPEKRLPEKTVRTENTRVPKKDVLDEKLNSKSPSPMPKGGQNKSKSEIESQKLTDCTKKDPRLKKRTQEKTSETKDDDQKEKKRREDTVPQRFKGKLVNGSVSKHNRDDSAEKADFKSGGNARTHARKRTRSRSRSRSPASSPKRKDRRSPKSRARSSSLSPSPHKAGKPRRVRTDEPQHAKPGREDRTTPKKDQSESRRSKRPGDERHSESRDSHSPRGHDGGNKELKEAPHRWRSGWEENKHLKLTEETRMKSGSQRHKPYNMPPRPTTPRTPKHRLSVDANLQIPDVLNSASKKDLLRRASKRLESGEISEEAFLNMAHQIKHFFQYREEKQQQRSESWDESADLPLKKPPLLTTPNSAPARPREDMDEAELTYYEHKSKLRKTQVTHRPAGEECTGEESPEDSEAQGGKPCSGRRGGHQAPRIYNRLPRDRPGERRSKEREEPQESQHGSGPMIEEYNHGKEFPPLKSLPGLRFRRRADPRDTSEREWNSPLTERQRFEDRDDQKSGYDAQRRYPADSRHPDSRRPEGPPPSGTVVLRNCPSPVPVDGPRFERERLSPLHQKDSAEMSPIPRFESPNSEHSDDGPLNLDPPPVSHPPLPKSILKVSGHSTPLPTRQHSDSPGHTPPHDGGHASSRYDGPNHMGPSRPQPQGWFDGRYEDSARFDGPHHPGPGRFEGGPPHHERFEGPSPHMAHGPMRGFDGPPHPQGPGRFDGPPVRFDGPIQRFDGPRCFDNNMAPGPGPGSGSMGFQRPMRFEGPQNQMGPMHFDGQGQPGPRFDMPHQGGPPRYDCPQGQHGPQGQQGPPHFAPQHNLQPPMRPIVPAMYDNNIPPQQNFNMAPQRFPEPMNPQFPTGPLAFPPQGGNFMQPAPFTQPSPYYNTTGPGVNMQQPVNMMGNIAQPFIPQNPVPFPQPAPQENHFGQVDVNDLLSKLISNGIIKPSQPEADPTTSNECTTIAPPPAAIEEEDEEEPEQEVEEEDLPDLTSFTVDNMKPRYESVVTKLYSGNQCCLCSMRFTAAQTDMYADHLDWHFRQNHAGKVASKKVTHRRWYYSLTDWIEFEEIADLEERAKSQFFEKENEEEVQKNQAAAKEKEFQSVRATKDQVGESCEICQEPFETYWVEEEEDWFLKNAIRVDDKNFHPSCFEDYKNTSSYLDVTPSPNKLLTEHPLSFLKTEEDDSSSCAVAATATSASIKQEVECASGELLNVKQEEEPEAVVDSNVATTAVD